MQQAGFGAVDVGYRAVQSLRLEKHYLAWAADITADDDPYEAGLALHTRPDKPELLAGPALRTIRDRGPARRLSWFTASADVVMHGGELLVLPDGRLTPVKSAGFGHTVGENIFCAYVPAEVAASSEFVVEIMGNRHPVRHHTAPPYDPQGVTIRA
ncbi:glycine cleavage T C-terminal barrel domain-containing protein [Nonomuraea endophytica]|uniref:glycine cleavage T C-terminal barrel domain-containing protein n=1 Tax=Nonomuraea endophytica TaxID=714136 RepID=UPI001FE70A2C|nr:glycine cleavage T C-terminal barrel domain-containing protein [Nonomuraea endophytica]